MAELTYDRCLLILDYEKWMDGNIEGLRRVREALQAILERDVPCEKEDVLQCVELMESNTR